jgi:hypothetical protein
LVGQELQELRRLLTDFSIRDDEIIIAPRRTEANLHRFVKDFARESVLVNGKSAGQWEKEYLLRGHPLKLLGVPEKTEANINALANEQFSPALIEALALAYEQALNNFLFQTGFDYRNGDEVLHFETRFINQSTNFSMVVPEGSARPKVQAKITGDFIELYMPSAEADSAKRFVKLEASIEAILTYCEQGWRFDELVIKGPDSDLLWNLYKAKPASLSFMESAAHRPYVIARLNATLRPLRPLIIPSYYAKNFNPVFGRIASRVDLSDLLSPDLATLILGDYANTMQTLMEAPIDEAAGSNMHAIKAYYRYRFSQIAYYRWIKLLLAGESEAAIQAELERQIHWVNGVYYNLSLIPLRSDSLNDCTAVIRDIEIPHMHSEGMLKLAQSLDNLLQALVSVHYQMQQRAGTIARVSSASELVEPLLPSAISPELPRRQAATAASAALNEARSAIAATRSQVARRETYSMRATTMPGAWFKSLCSGIFAPLLGLLKIAAALWLMTATLYICGRDISEMVNPKDQGLSNLKDPLSALWIAAAVSQIANLAVMPYGLGVLASLCCSDSPRGVCSPTVRKVSYGVAMFWAIVSVLATWGRMISMMANAKDPEINSANDRLPVNELFLATFITNGVVMNINVAIGLIAYFKQHPVFHKPAQAATAILPRGAQNSAPVTEIQLAPV